MIHIIFDETNSPGMVVTVSLEPLGGAPASDADILSLAQAILASDAVQNNPQWNAPPSLTSVGIDTSRSLYP